MTKSLISCGVNHFFVCECGAVLGTEYMKDNRIPCTRCTRSWKMVPTGEPGSFTERLKVTDAADVEVAA